MRAGSQATVRDLRDAGVQVVMITGDHPSTAEAVAEELDVLNGGIVVTGTELDALDDDALDELIPHVRVIARGTPSHKVRAVQAFQRLGRTVAMTGDGANDAPAIRLADVGIALGRRGTPAARAAADLVITDDRLETILAALVEGRAMWASVREALGVLVGGNLGEIAFTVLGAATTGTSPLNARQLLLVNLLTDLVPSLALAVRAPGARVGGRAAGRGAGGVAGRRPQPRDRAAGHGHRGRREPRVAARPRPPRTAARRGPAPSRSRRSSAPSSDRPSSPAAVAARW